MKDWIPLFQNLVWPLFCLLVLAVFHRPVRDLLAEIQDRVRRGASFEAGASGIKLGSVSAPTSASVVVAPAAAEAVAPVGADYEPAAIEGSQEETGGLEGSGLPHPIYIVHSAIRDRALDRGELLYYRLRIYLDADESQLLDTVSHVVYQLHPTFVQPRRVVSDRATAFELRTAVWGEFNMTAEVHFRDGRKLLLIERYINLPGAAA